MDALFRTKNVNQERFQCSPNSEKPVVFRSSSMVWYTPVTNESGTTPPWWSPSPPPFAGLIVYLGMMVGAFLWGALADRIGRRQSLLISLSINSVFSFFSSFVQGYSMFLLCRMVSGFGWEDFSILLYVLVYSTILYCILLLYTEVYFTVFYTVVLHTTLLYYTLL